MSDPPIAYADWLKEARARLPSDATPLDMRFKCPLCGNVATPRDFKDAGADPQRAPHECIGRTATPMVKAERGKQPCDYAAFGFIPLGRPVLMPGGTIAQVFPFADHQGDQ